MPFVFRATGSRWFCLFAPRLRWSLPSHGARMVGLRRRHRRDLPRRLIVFGHRACNGGTTDTCFVCAAVLSRPRLNNIKDLFSNEKNYCRCRDKPRKKNLLEKPCHMNRKRNIASLSCLRLLSRILSRMTEIDWRDDDDGEFNLGSIRVTAQRIVRLAKNRNSARLGFLDRARSLAKNCRLLSLHL